VGARVNARLEHLFLDFENNCVKLYTDVYVYVYILIVAKQAK